MLHIKALALFNETCHLNPNKLNLVDLLRAATKGQLRTFNGQFYEQIDGVAMGSPLGSLLVNATNSTASPMRCFLFTNWDLPSMCNLTQFVIRFLISFSLVFSVFVRFYCPFTPANLYTPYVHIYRFTVLFYHSRDNDRSTVETYCFTVDFYR